MTAPASELSNIHSDDGKSGLTLAHLERTSQSPSQQSQCWDPRILGMGGTATITLYDEGTVLKGYVVWLDGQRKIDGDHDVEAKASLDREREVYTRLRAHPHILTYLGQVEVEPGIYSLRLEYAGHGDLRSFIRTNKPVPLALRRKWATDLACGLTHIHAKGVFHCDFSCRNVLLTSLDTVKIGDFGGAIIDDMDPYTAEEVWYELPLRGRAWEQRPYSKREIFALGCAIYEIMAWKKPFADLTAEEVEARYAREDFPDLTDVFADEIIRGCWQEAFDCPQQVKVALEASGSAEREICRRTRTVTSPTVPTSSA